jgi:sugar lactone lactonase YvrE
MHVKHTLVLGLVACSSSPEKSAKSTQPNPYADRDSVGTTTVFATGFEGGTEGITVSPDGRMFVSADGAVVEVFPDGSWTEVAPLPGAIGVAWRGDRLLVASSDSGEGLDTGGVFELNVDSGEKTLLASGIDSANFVTVTPWDTLLVAVPQGDTLWEIDAAGTVSPWLEGLESPNGMVFDPTGSTLYVATTFVVPETLWAVPVSDSQAGTPQALAVWDPAGVGDGIALDADGAVYVSQNVVGRIDRVWPDGTEEVLSAEVPFTASLAFGDGAVWDRCQVFSTSLFTPDLLAVEAGVQGFGP